jgi:hypothetical protein
MSHRPLNVIAVLLLATIGTAAKDASPAPSAPKHLSDIRTVCLINTNADLDVFDKLRVRLQEWGRWKIVEQPEQADLLLVLSQDREIDHLAPHPRQLFELYAPSHWPTAGELDTLSLVAVDRATDRQLVRVSCARHHFPPASDWLTSRLRKKIAKREKSGK